MSQPSQRVSFHIEGMDCAEEVTVLRRVIGPLVGGESNLSFEVLNGKMSLLVDSVSVSTNEIVEAVSGTGMRARPWQAYSVGQGSRQESFWDRRGRSLMCASSGVLLLAAFGIQAVHEGGILFALQAETAPLTAIAHYLAATILGIWFVLPKGLYAASVMPQENSAALDSAAVL